MKISITQDAMNWYKENMDLQQGDALRFYGKVYGGRSGFSLAVVKMPPTRPYTIETIEGISFYVEHGDAWYFEGKDLEISMHDTYNEPDYELV